MTLRMEPRWIAAIIAAVAIAVGAWLLLSGDDDDDGGGNASPSNDAKELTASTQVSELKDLADGTGHDVYWVGREGGVSYEWTELPTGEVYVRYLTGGAEAGDPNPAYLTVGTYPVGDGIAAIETASQEDGAETFAAPDSGTALVNESAPSSVYVAFPGSEYQIEVYHPDPEVARELVESGSVQPLN